MSEYTLASALVAVLAMGYAAYLHTQNKKRPPQPPTLNTDETESSAKEILINAKDQALKIKEEAKEEAEIIRVTSLKIEERLHQKEERLEKNLEELRQQENSIKVKLEKIQTEMAEVADLKNRQLERLEKVATLSKKEAEQLIMKRVEDNLSQEIGKKIKEAEEKIKEVSDIRAREILADIMKYGATEYVPEYTTSVIAMKDPELKGRIIGKEGRNIKAFERATGVNVELDETPGEIRLSCFDPVRREIAKIALEQLIKDGRIQPARIEEVVQKTTREIEQMMFKAGEELCHQVNVYNLPKELVALLGRFKYRYSYGQNMIQHTLEETQIGIKLAKELGADADIVRLACLLHDIGKVIDDNEKTHVQAGVEILKKHELPAEVIACVAQHHEDEPLSSVEALIVYIADAISASRPGARHEDYDAYIKRMEDLEKIALSFTGVDHAYAISAGREIRVVVTPEEIDDLSAYKLAQDIATKIERELVYPGQVKVTVVREVRAEETAR